MPSTLFVPKIKGRALMAPVEAIAQVLDIHLGEDRKRLGSVDRHLGCRILLKYLSLN